MVAFLPHCMKLVTWFSGWEEWQAYYGSNLSQIFSVMDDSNLKIYLQEWKKGEERIILSCSTVSCPGVGLTLCETHCFLVNRLVLKYTIILILRQYCECVQLYCTKKMCTLVKNHNWRTLRTNSIIGLYQAMLSYLMIIKSVWIHSCLHSVFWWTLITSEILCCT